MSFLLEIIFTLNLEFVHSPLSTFNIDKVSSFDPLFNAHHFQTSSTRRIAPKPNQTMLVFGDDEKNRKNSSKPIEAMQKTNKLAYFW